MTYEEACVIMKFDERKEWQKTAPAPLVKAYREFITMTAYYVRNGVQMADYDIEEWRTFRVKLDCAHQLLECEVARYGSMH